jgi:hypothetical protein
LLLLAGFVDDEGGALGFLLGDLLGFDGGGEFGGEGEVLWGVSGCSALEWMGKTRYHNGGMEWRYGHTVRETSSSMMLNFAARIAKFSLTSLATFSRWVINCEALNCATTDFKTSLTIDGRILSS